MPDLDNRSKRASSVNILIPSTLAPPEPDASIDQADQQHIALSYSGILATSPATNVPIMTTYGSYAQPVG